MTTATANVIFNVKKKSNIGTSRIDVHQVNTFSFTGLYCEILWQSGMMQDPAHNPGHAGETTFAGKFYLYFKTKVRHESYNTT